MLRGSRRPVVECGLGGRICRVGQRTWRRSVVCGEKTPRGSRKPVVQCGLWRENAAWVKKAGGGVWSRRANLLPGSRRPAMQCGLWRENAAWVKKAGGVVWSRRANLSPGSRRPAAECGLGGRICCLGQEGRRCSVVCGAKTPRESKELLV